MEFGQKIRRLGTGAGLVLAAAVAMVAAPVTQASAAPPVPPATYTVVNVNSGMCLETSGTGPDAVIFQTHCKVSGQTNLLLQRWTFQSVNDVDAYRVSGFATGQCWAIGSGARHDGAWLIQWHCLGSADQTWRLVPSGAGFAIVNVNSGKCLAIGAGARHAGAIAIQWTCFGSPEQQWTLRRV